MPELAVVGVVLLCLADRVRTLVGELRRRRSPRAADRHVGPWTAAFLDGPCVEQRGEWSVGPVFRDLWLAPFATYKGYIVVGYSGFEPAEPWPGQVHYRLDSLEDSSGEPVAWYFLVD